jgi:deoxyribodipyrimidine photo-lyase
MIVLLKEQLESLGTSLLVLHGNPVEIFSALSPKAVYTNRDYEPYARERDSTVSENLTKRGIEFKTFKDHVIFERDEILKPDGSPYTVFTPYGRKWKASLNDFYLKSYPVSRYFENFKKVSALRYHHLKT